MRLDKAVGMVERAGYKVRYAYNPDPGTEVMIQWPSLRQKPAILLIHDQTLVARGHRERR